MAKTFLTNTAAGARGVHTKEGELIMIEAGATSAALDLDDQEIKDALAGDFEKGKASDAAVEDGAGDPPAPDAAPENEPKKGR